MSREIKFRAWILTEDSWMQDDETIYTYEMCYDLAFEDYEPINDLLNGVKNLMQYTGLKDKNGKEIYEGDIIECFLGDELDRVEIYYSSEFAIFDFKPRDSDDTLSDLIFFGYTVIGNIYENPELLYT